MILGKIKACKYRENSTKKTSKGSLLSKQIPSRQPTYPLPLKMLILFPMWDTLVPWRVPSSWVHVFHLEKALIFDGENTVILRCEWKKTEKSKNNWKSERSFLLFWQNMGEIWGAWFSSLQGRWRPRVLVSFLLSLSESQKSPKLLLYNDSNMNDWNLRKATVGKRNTNLR